jgi:hypothetical protein
MRRRGFNPSELGTSGAAPLPAATDVSEAAAVLRAAVTRIASTSVLISGA